MEIMQSEFFCILQQEASNLSKMRILSDAFTVKNRACKGPQLGPCYLINSHDLLRRHVSSLVRKLPTNFFCLQISKVNEYILVHKREGAKNGMMFCF